MIKRTITLAVAPGETVYLLTDKNQEPRLVRDIWLKPVGILYELVCGKDSSWHSDFEISREKGKTSSDVSIEGFKYMKPYHTL